MKKSNKKQITLRVKQTKNQSKRVYAATAAQKKSKVDDGVQFPLAKK